MVGAIQERKPEKGKEGTEEMGTIQKTAHTKTKAKYNEASAPTVAALFEAFDPQVELQQVISLLFVAARLIQTPNLNILARGPAVLR